MTKDEAVTIVGYLNAAYPNNKMDDSAGVVYVTFLLDLDFECCRYAIKQWIQREKWFPTVADIAQATRAEMRRVTPQGVLKALEPGGRTLSREENLERLKGVQAQLRNAKGPLFNPRERAAALGSDRPAPPAPRSPGGRSPSSPAEPTAPPEQPTPSS